MGWASGSYLAQDLYATIRKHIPKDKREKVANAFIDAFEQHDADDWEQGDKLWEDSGRPTWEDELEDG